MHRTSIGIAIFLLAYYGITHGHIVDIHLPNAEEHQMMEEARRQQEIREATQTLSDEDATHEQQLEAIQTLADNGAMV